MNAQDNTKLFVYNVVDAAMADAKANIPARHKTNTSSVLIKRLNLNRYRSTPRNGDGREARRVYTAVRFLYETELKSGEDGS